MKITDKQLDDVYDTLDYLMTKGQWTILEDLFIYWGQTAWRTELDLLLAYATASLPAKTKIVNRPAFIKQCMKFHPDPELWKGLE
jgi:hypothetical protein